ncbi:MAG: hypothetical protein ACI9VR_003543 [Cognaticolwellia sp.]|jgi:hypothetical protein
MNPLLILLSCASAPDPAPNDAPMAPALAAASAPPAAPAFFVPPAPTGPPDGLPDLHGQTDAQILAYMGPPTKKRAFTMADCCSEYDIELYNTYAPNGGHDAVAIEHWSWAYDGYTAALWFHQIDGTWTVLNSVRYGEGTDF